MLGMTLALELARDGHQVTLFEGSDRLGGLADAWRLGDVVWDRHYHVTLLSDTALRGLLMDLGLERKMKWVTARTGFYSGGRLYSLSSSFEFLSFPLLRLSDKLRLAATILHASRVRDGSQLEKTSVEAPGRGAVHLKRSGCRCCGRNWETITAVFQPLSYGRPSAACTLPGVKD